MEHFGGAQITYDMRYYYSNHSTVHEPEIIFGVLICFKFGRASNKQSQSPTLKSRYRLPIFCHRQSLS